MQKYHIRKVGLLACLALAVLLGTWNEARAQAYDLVEVRSAVSGLEQRIEWSMVKACWRPRRDGWIGAVNCAGTPQRLGQLILELEAHTTWEAVTSSWRCRRDDWVSELRQATSARQVTRLLYEFECHLIFRR